eukprot:216117_1
MSANMKSNPSTNTIHSNNAFTTSEPFLSNTNTFILNKKTHVKLPPIPLPLLPQLSIPKHTNFINSPQTELSDYSTSDTQKEPIDLIIPLTSNINKENINITIASTKRELEIKKQFKQTKQHKILNKKWYQRNENKIVSKVLNSNLY